MTPATELPPRNAHAARREPAGTSHDKPGVRVLVRYAWDVFRTRVIWGARLHSLGTKSILGRKLAVRNSGAVAIGSRVTICDEYVLADLAPGRGALPKIRIGDGTVILYRFQCNAAESVTIGPDVLIASNVLITDSDHVLEPGGIPVTRNPALITRPVVVERNCWIGQNAVILKGVTIGHDSIIGANSVVTRDVAPYSVVAGNPARLIRSTLPDASGVARLPDESKEQPAWKP